MKEPRYIEEPINELEDIFYKVKDSQMGRNRVGQKIATRKGIRSMSYGNKLKYYGYRDCLLSREVLDFAAIATQLKRGK